MTMNENLVDETDPTQDNMCCPKHHYWNPSAHKDCVLRARYYLVFKDLRGLGQTRLYREGTAPCQHLRIPSDRCEASAPQQRAAGRPP